MTSLTLLGSLAVSDDAAVVLFFGLVAVVVIVITVCITVYNLTSLRSRERVERWKIGREPYGSIGEEESG